MNKMYFTKRLFSFLILLLCYFQPSYSQCVENEMPPNFKNKLFIKAGISSDYDLNPYWGYNYSFGYGRNIWKNLNISIFYAHCQTNTLKGSFYFNDNPYSNGSSNYINRYLGITVEDYLGGVGVNGLNVHDAFCIKAAYDFKVGKHVYISPFLALLMAGVSLARFMWIQPVL